MHDPRINTLARLLVQYSLKVQPKERVLIQSNGYAAPLVKALIREVYDAGALPFAACSDRSLERELLLRADEEQLTIWAAYDLARMKEMDCYIGFTALDNQSEWSDIPAANVELYNTLYNTPVHMQQRLDETRWVVLRYPTAASAQLAGMSTEAFEDFFFSVCTLDYARMDRAMDALAARMARTDMVRITGPGTDISFSIRGMPQIKCSGEKNIPDGELYTAPVRESVNGRITYNTPSLQSGFVFEHISFDFTNGRITGAHANDTERLTRILDTDEGARYVGEFSFGLNPYILKPMRETLFDEKIAGSIHFTPGNAYTDCDNGNRSAVHWDLVLIQRPEYGGGEIYFDGELIRKDGLFVPDDLQCLNPRLLS